MILYWKTDLALHKSVKAQASLSNRYCSGNRCGAQICWSHQALADGERTVLFNVHLDAKAVSPLKIFSLSFMPYAKKALIFFCHDSAFSIQGICNYVIACGLVRKGGRKWQNTNRKRQNSASSHSSANQGHIYSLTLHYKQQMKLSNKWDRTHVYRNLQ